MGADRTRDRLDAASAERLIAGEDVGFGDLSALLAAAAAPPRPQETAGETAALVAFRYANLGPYGGQRRRSAAKPMWTRLASIKAAAIAVALASAGVALAAGTGVLPDPFTSDPSTAAPSLTSGHPRTTGRTAPGTTTTNGTSSAPSSSTTAPGSAGLKGLCEAYQAQAEKDHEKALDNPSYRRLIDAAGGRDKVDDYCVDLVGEPAGGRPSDHPGNTAHPTGAPGGQPTPQSTRRPGTT